MGSDMDTNDEWRVEFDADVTFSNGGALQAQEFRLDIAGRTIEDDELGELIVRHLGLLMVRKVVIRRKSYLREPHKGGRGVAAGRAGRSVLDLTGERTAATLASGSGLAELVDLDVVLVRLAGSTAGGVTRAALVSFEVRGRAVLLHEEVPMPDDAGSGLTEAAARWLVANGAAVVGSDHADLGIGGRVLQASGVPTVTSLRGLEDVPTTSARLHVVPSPSTTGPARVYVIVGAG